MKVRYIKNHTDEFGQVFPKGCVAEHDEKTAEDRIAHGLCEETNQNAFSRRMPAEVAVSTDCVVPENAGTVNKKK